MILTRGYSIHSARVSSVSLDSAPGIRLKCSTVVLDETNSFRDPDFFWWMRLKNFLFQVPIKLKNRNESLRFIFQEFFLRQKKIKTHPLFHLTCLGHRASGRFRSLLCQKADSRSEIERTLGSALRRILGRIVCQ